MHFLLGDINAVTNPMFITELVALITALTALFKLFTNSSKIDDTAAKVSTIHDNTNGTIDALHKTIEHLATTQATPEELAARAARAGPTTPDK